MQARATLELLLLRSGRDELGGLEAYDKGVWLSGELDKCTSRLWMSLVGDTNNSPSWGCMTEFSSSLAASELAGSALLRAGTTD